MEHTLTYPTKASSARKRHYGMPAEPLTPDATTSDATTSAAPRVPGAVCPAPRPPLPLRRVPVPGADGIGLVPAAPVREARIRVSSAGVVRKASEVAS